MIKSNISRVRPVANTSSTSSLFATILRKRDKINDPESIPLIQTNNECPIDYQRCMSITCPFKLLSEFYFSSPERQAKIDTRKCQRDQHVRYWLESTVTNTINVYPYVPEGYSDQFYTEQTISIKTHQHCLLLSDGKTALIECNLPCKYGRPINGEEKHVSDRKKSRRSTVAKYRRLSQRRKSKWTNQQSRFVDKLFIICNRLFSGLCFHNAIFSLWKNKNKNILH